MTFREIDAEDYACNRCGRSFDSEEGLRDHEAEWED
jgi:DNA-directed RNA polymerase subunit RPC12/RpoP